MNETPQDEQTATPGVGCEAAGYVAREDALALAALMYADEPCRICGHTITREDRPEAVFAGYGTRTEGGGEARSAHGDCWHAQSGHKGQWAYPIDAE